MLRLLRIQQRDQRTAAILAGQHRFLFAVAGEWSGHMTLAYALPDGSILIAKHGDSTSEPPAINWHDSLSDACALYQSLQCDYNVRIREALLALATVPQPAPSPMQVKINDLLAKWQKLRREEPAMR